MRKQLIAYVYNLCAWGDLCVRCTSFAHKRLIVYVVRRLRSKRLIAYVVRLLRSRRLMLQVLTVQSCNEFDRENCAVTEILWVRPIVRWQGSCDDWRSLKDLVGLSNHAMTGIVQWLDLNRCVTVRSWNESKDLNRLITVQSYDDSKDYNRSITVRSYDNSKDYNRSVTVRSCRSERLMTLTVL